MSGGIAGFGTVLSRLGEVAMGYSAAAQEREDAARAERSKLIQTGLQMGASGLDATQFISPDLVSRDNQKWLTDKFQPMGDKFTQPYKDAQTRQQQALQGEREFNLMLERFKQSESNRRAHMGAQATVTAAALRANGRDRDEPTVLDQLRLDEATDTLIARQFGQLVPDAYDKDGKIKPEYGAALADFTDKVRSRITNPGSLADLRGQIVRAGTELGPKPVRTDAPYMPGSPTYKMQYKGRSPEALIADAIKTGNIQVSRQTTPSQRYQARERILSSIEREFGPAARAQAERELER
jgi:hypothetical protein